MVKLIIHSLELFKTYFINVQSMRHIERIEVRCQQASKSSLNSEDTNMTTVK